MKRLTACLSLVLCLVLASAAHGDETRRLTLTVYNQGRALVNEVRAMALPSGQGRVEFLGVPETIEPASLQVRSITSPRGFTVLDMNYEYDLVSVRNLLDRYVGKTVRVVLPSSSDTRDLVVREAVLLANNDRPIFRVGGEIYVGDYESVMLAEMPEGLRARPALVWLVDNQGPATQDVEVSYLAGGLGWRADYVLKLDRESETAALSGWVTLTNESGMSFEGAELKLVAGDLNVVRPEVMRMMAAAPAFDGAVQENVREEQFFEYHLYNVARPVTVLNRQTKQISLFSAPSLGVDKTLVSSFYSSVRSSTPEPIRQTVEVFISLVNSRENGLGIPLPRGTVRAYQQSLDGAVLLVGEDSIDHTPEDETLRLKMGEAFDLTVERRLLDYRRLGDRRHRMTWAITIRNAKQRNQRLTLRESFPGQWRISDPSHDFERMGAGTIEFNLDVPPTDADDGMVVSYTVTIDQ